MKEITINRKTSIIPLLDNYTYIINNNKKVKVKHYFHLFPRVIKIKNDDYLTAIQKTMRIKIYIIIAVLLCILLFVNGKNEVYVYLFFPYIVFVKILYEALINKGKIGVIKQNNTLVGNIIKKSSSYSLFFNYYDDYYEIYLHSDNIISICKNNIQCGIIKLYEYIDMGVYKYSVKFDEMVIDENLILLITMISDCEWFSTFSKHKGFIFKRRAIFAPLKINTKNRYDKHKDRKKY